MSSSSSSSSPLPASALSSLRPAVAELKRKLDLFVDAEVIPAEAEYDRHMKARHGRDRWTMDALPPALMRLQRRARALGLWNLFLPPKMARKLEGMGLADLCPAVPLSYREYGILCESMGRSIDLAPQACNCSAPDTGNMEVLIEFGTPEQQRRYLRPLLEGKMRSMFGMTEPAVASSDATNLEGVLKKLSDNSYSLTARKWWSTGAMDPRCGVALVVAKMDYSQCPAGEASSGRRHGAHTIVCVPLPHPRVRAIRPLTVFGYDDAPFGHAEVAFEGVPLDASDLVGGEGSGFRVSQARLGPGRIHHCMRAIGCAQRCYDLMLERSMQRKTFGKALWEHGGMQEVIADCASDLRAARLLTLDCASAMDAVGARLARDRIASIKVSVPRLTCRVIDAAVQAFGGAGVSDDFVLARSFAGMRTLRIADGPDAVHQRTVAKLEIAKAKAKAASRGGSNESGAYTRSRL